MTPQEVHRRIIFKFGEALEMVPPECRVDHYIVILLNMLAEKDNDITYLKKRLERCQHCCKEQKNG